MFLQVAQFVCNHVVDALRGRFDQVWVQGDHACCRTTAPGTLHLSQTQGWHPAIRPACGLADQLKTGAEVPAGLLPVPADEPVVDGFCPDIRSDDPYLSIDEVHTAAFIGFPDHFQGMALPQEKMPLAADIPVHWPFPQLGPGIDEKTSDAGHPLLQGLVDGSPTHAPGGDYPQLAIAVQLKVDPAGNGGPVVNLVFDELTVVLKGFDLLFLQI